MFAPRNTVALVHNDHLVTVGVDDGEIEIVGVTPSVGVGCSVGVNRSFVGESNAVGTTFSECWGVQDIPTELIMSVTRNHTKYFRKDPIVILFLLRK